MRLKRGEAYLIERREIQQLWGGSKHFIVSQSVFSNCLLGVNTCSDLSWCLYPEKNFLYTRSLWLRKLRSGMKRFVLEDGEN